MKEIRVLEALGMATEWDDPAPSNATKMVNIFQNTRKEAKKVKTHVEMVWAKTLHGIAVDQTPKYFRDFGGA
eukprot:8820897-Ditylum_brightwellii.AAC.1